MARVVYAPWGPDVRTIFDENVGRGGFRVVETFDEGGAQAFVATKEHEALITAIDGALDELRADGTLAEISDKYFGADVTE